MPFFALHDDEEIGSVAPSDSAQIIGVCGGTASGKTSVCRKIHEMLSGNGRVVILSQDSYYRGLTAEENATADTYDFDHPSAFDWDLIREHLARLGQRKPIDVPHYDFTTHKRTSETTTIYAADVVLFEGILSFSEERVRELMDMKIFVDTDDDTRLIRRIRRDLATRGRTLESILTQYETFVKPSFDLHIAPTKRYADVIIPRGETNTVAIGLVARHIQERLTQRGGKSRK